MHSKTFKIQISGRVQGVGFRPFIFNLAKRNNLVGSVSNNANGVVVYINSSKEKATLFLNQILKEKPEVSIITVHSIEEFENIEYTNFTIIPSKSNVQINIPLTPDFAICNNCKAEIKDSSNRRFNYAFTTCVHCGPRYAITTKFPFERVNTALSNFEMCSDCNDEYTTSENKRFHSQTNSCSVCGISLKLVDTFGKPIEEDQQEIIQKVAQYISEGKIIAIKNTNGYLLCCDAANSKAIQNLRDRKLRPNKPFAVLYPTIEAIKTDFDITKNEETSLQSRVAPIVILQNSKNTKINTKVIAPNLSQTGVMLPSSSLLELIMQELKKPITATSGNIHGSPIISDEKEAQEQLMNVADYFVHHDLKIEFPQDDSVVKFIKEKQVILRRSRGLAPNYLELETQNTEPILAMGAHLKSSFTFVPNQHIYVSQNFGNLDNYKVLQRYEQTIQQYENLFNSKPLTILVDKHPQYQSTILGKELSQENNTKLIEVQHHKAHFASVLGEHNLYESEEKILGVVWDGTGLGDDNNIWGGEFFIYQDQKIIRSNHFEYFNWISNDKMAKEPRLSLFSLLNDETRHLIKDKFSETEWKVYSKTLKSNTLKTSSVGRLFDAVASALDIIDVNSYEAEAAMLLENCAMSYTNHDYVDLLEVKNYDTIPSELLIQIVTKAYKLDGTSKTYIAASFIYTLAKLIVNEALKNSIKTITCSGGVFQNSVLVSFLSDISKQEKINLKFNRKLSPNDENISFGQLMYFNNIIN
ncbi:MAG: carbamoyltransferase HypF [Flavobacteriaceae bacterium]|nr:carbamoyltransferase HypF [Flavobacteriaceae bacterium]